MTSQTAEQAQPRVGPRGRRAKKPTQIPAKGWKDIVVRIFKEIGNDRVMLVAAGVTYYLLLALVPALTAIVSIFGLFADPVTVAEQVKALKGVIPGGGMEILNEQLQRLTEQGDRTLGFTFLLSLGVALWTTNAGMKALFDAMNVAYDEQEERSFVKLTLVSLGFTFLSIIAAIGMVGMTVVLPTVLAFLPWEAGVEQAITVISYLVVALLALGFICLLYRYGPDRDPAKWRWITPGAVVAALLVAVTSVGFSYYVSNFGSYNATYGSLGALIGFLTWVWLSNTILIIGGELNAEMEHQTRADTTIGERQPMGTRDAEMADELGAAAGKDGGSVGDGADASRGSNVGPVRRPVSINQLAVMVPLAIAVGLMAGRK